MASRAGEESLRSEQCQQAGGPAGPGRSLFTVSSANQPVASTGRGDLTPRQQHQKLVKSIGGETPLLPGQSAPPINQRNFKAAASSARLTQRPKLVVVS